jgi:RNA-directed DNA polymerase
VRQHPNKGKKWVKNKYFHSERGRNWIFRSIETVEKKGKKETVKVDLYKLSSMPIERFVKVAGMNSPDDPSLDDYWK